MHLHRRWRADRAAPMIIALVALLPCFAGCQQNPYADSSIANMSNEIRVLEDQLYECDFENRRLLQEIQRLEQSSSSTGRSGSRTANPSDGTANNNAATDNSPSTRGPRSSAQRDPSSTRDKPKPKADGSQGKEKGGNDVKRGKPEPPTLRPDDLQPPDVDAGDSSPPELPEPVNDEVQPAGQVRIPMPRDPNAPGIDPLAGPAVGLQFDPVLTQPWDLDANQQDDAVRVVLRAIDRDGRIARLPTQTIALRIVKAEVPSAATVIQTTDVANASFEEPNATLAIVHLTAAQLEAAPRTADGAGIEVMVPFEQSAADQRDVILFASFPSDANAIESDRVLHIRSPRTTTDGWIAR
jgi:hypothetical protein